jgi:flagellar motor switch/type III secretory pathway protein FliN
MIPGRGHPQTVSALRLREVSAAQCALARLLRNGVVATLEISGEAAELAIELPPPASRYPPSDWIVLQGRSGLLVIGEGVTLLRVLTGIDVGVADDLSDWKRAWLLQQALALLPESIRSLLDDPFEIGATTIDEPMTLAWADASLRVGTAGVRFCVGAHIPTWHRMLDSPRFIAVSASPIACQFRLACTVGRCVMSASAVCALAEGDAILDAAGLFDIAGEGIVNVGPRAMRGRIDVMDGRAIFEFMRWENAMSTEPESGGEVPVDEDVEKEERLLDDFSDVPISITFDLGHISLTYQETHDLAPGSVLVVNTQVVPPDVVVRANGARIGYGTLVEVNGRLAVQITSMFRGA